MKKTFFYEGFSRSGRTKSLFKFSITLDLLNVVQNVVKKIENFLMWPLIIKSSKYVGIDIQKLTMKYHNLNGNRAKVIS